MFRQRSLRGFCAQGRHFETRRHKVIPERQAGRIAGIMTVMMVVSAAVAHAQNPGSVDLASRTVSVSITKSDGLFTQGGASFNAIVNTAGLVPLVGNNPIALLFVPTTSYPEWGGSSYAAGTVVGSGGNINSTALFTWAGSLAGSVYVGNWVNPTSSTDFTTRFADVEWYSGDSALGTGGMDHGGGIYNLWFETTAGATVPYQVSDGWAAYLDRFDPGGTVTFNGDLTLERILAVDPANPRHVYAEASFDDEGNAYFTTPEPSSIVLLGTGLLGLAPLVRRKFTYLI